MVMVPELEKVPRGPYQGRTEERTWKLRDSVWA